MMPLRIELCLSDAEADFVAARRSSVDRRERVAQAFERAMCFFIVGICQKRDEFVAAETPDYIAVAERGT